MQDAVNGQHSGDVHKAKDARNNPIEGSATTDPVVDPLANGNPKPPFGGPDGGDQDER